MTGVLALAAVVALVVAGLRDGVPSRILDFPSTALYRRIRGPM